MGFLAYESSLLKMVVVSVNSIYQLFASCSSMGGKEMYTLYGFSIFEFYSEGEQNRVGKEERLKICVFPCSFWLPSFLSKQTGAVFGSCP